MTGEKNISFSPGAELTAEATAVSPCTAESGNSAAREKHRVVQV